MNNHSRHLFLTYTIFFLLCIQQIFPASKAQVRGNHGMVVSSHELASQVGVEILKKGGNAVDAAVAVGFALAVVYPSAGNLGGGGFMVIHFPNGESTAIDFREVAPQKAHREMYLNENGEIIKGLSTDGYLSSGVPGSVAGLTFALEKYGTMKLSTVMKPAIELAKKGFPVSYNFHNDLKQFKNDFLKYKASARQFLKSDRSVYNEGEIFKQPVLAKTLKLISKKGGSAFYKGKIAELIANDMASHGGIITKQDLANYRVKQRPAVTGRYHDYKIISMPPPSSGGIAIVQALNILEQFNLKAMGYNSSQYIHIVTETLKRVFCDRAKFVGDPEFVDVPIERLIDKSYAAELANKIDINTATPSSQISPGQLQLSEGDNTTHYAVVDKNQMVVSVTTTINTSYGSKVVIDGAGFLMNNEMDDFSQKPGAADYYGLVTYDANAIEPGKRMLSSMSPTIVLKDNKFFMTAGAAGGPRIITSVLQIILNVIEFDMTIQEAVDASRFHHQWLPDEIRFEKFAIAPDVEIKLKSMGHAINKQRNHFSEAHAILYNDNQKVFLGAADPRLEGKSVGY